jgi:acetoacetyl-CoA synthetase
MEPIWKPGKHRTEYAEISRFQNQVQDELGDDDYWALHRWSIENREGFWSQLWDFAGIVGDKGEPPYLEDGQLFPGSKWFPKAKLNYAENLMRRRDESPALISVREDGERRVISYADLYRLVAGLSAALRTEGVVAGDRVAGYMPNIIETTVAMLAAASIGAVWSSCSPDFGEQGLLDRFGQIEPKVLFTCDGYTYNGKSHDSLERIGNITKKLPSLLRIVIVPFLTEHPEITTLEQAVFFGDYLKPSERECHFVRLPFDHPLFVLYSSGTTGKPKCIIHSGGGALLEHQKEHLLHTDIGPKDVFFYFSTCGWMMWNWLVSGLATGCTIVLYDGSPIYPDADRLVQLIDQEQITIFGTSAKYISALEKAGLEPLSDYKLDSLKAILSTGSPLAPESFEYVYQKIKEDVLLSSFSGGTDLLGAFVSGNPCLPVYPGQLQCPGLGMDVDVVDDEGNFLREEKGELICRSSFPSVPIGFWNDPEQVRFRETYFGRFEGIWTHGDYAEITSNGGLIIYGRSDAILNPGGVRIGTAEIYRQVEKVEQVMESLVIGQNWKNDCRIVLFVRLQNGVILDEYLTTQIRETIRANTTPRHVPAKIIKVRDIPRTLSGKIAELAVRNVIHQQPVKNTEALANPESLSCYVDLKELQS